MHYSGALYIIHYISCVINLRLGPQSKMPRYRVRMAWSSLARPGARRGGSCMVAGADAGHSQVDFKKSK